MKVCLNISAQRVYSQQLCACRVYISLVYISYVQNILIIFESRSSMTHTSTWRQSLVGDRTSQITMDNFMLWKETQKHQVSQRGASSDVSAEEKYIQHMVHQNLNAYICHRELDQYMTCLKEKNYIKTDHMVGASMGIAGVNSNSHERHCRSAHLVYASCMQSRAHHETIIQNSVAEPSCMTQRVNFVECLDNNAAIESSNQVAQCSQHYRVLLRCGLNHLWNKYWRALVNLGETDEFHLYELERDDNKRQAYLDLTQRIQSS